MGCNHGNGITPNCLWASPLHGRIYISRVCVIKVLVLFQYSALSHVWISPRGILGDFLVWEEGRTLMGIYSNTVTLALPDPPSTQRICMVLPRLIPGHYQLLQPDR